MTKFERADINKVNKRGKTPLQILIENHRQNPQRLTKGHPQHHHVVPAQLNQPRGLSGMSSSSSTRPYRRHRGQHHHLGAGDGVEGNQKFKGHFKFHFLFQNHARIK